MRASLLLLFGLVISSAVGAADCYVTDECRVNEDGLVVCYNEPVDCCALKALQCDPHPLNTCVACEEGTGRIECSTPEGEPVDVVVREEPTEVSDEWGRGGLAGEGNDTGLWPRSGHYTRYRLED